ncbi:MAG: ABC transporter permease, partial [Oscillospiraceae bacterium]
LPMWMNFLLRTYAWMTLLEKTGIINRLLGLLGLGPFNMINTQGAVVLGMVYNYLPFMILPLYSVMTKIDKSFIEAAQDLGAHSGEVFKNVVLPLSVPGIMTGITMVFVPAVSTFIISRMLGGGSNMMIGDLIELQFLGNAYNPNLGAAISLGLMILILFCMSLLNQINDEDKEDMII